MSKLNKIDNEYRLNTENISKLDFVCDLCGSTVGTQRIHVRDALFSKAINQFDIIKCNICGMCEMNPFPTIEDIKEIYQEDSIFTKELENPYKQSLFFNILQPLYLKYACIRRYSAKKCIQLLNQKKSLQVFDIGCSSGILLEAFDKIDSSIQSKGIDLDPDIIDKAKQKFKSRIIVGDFLATEISQEFDAVTMCFVLEHVLDLNSYMQKAVSILKKNGILFISVPDIDSPKAVQQKETWKLINDKRLKIGHVRWFNHRSISVLAEKFGLEIEHICNIGESFFHFSQSKQKILKSIFGMDQTEERFIRSYTVRILYAIFVDYWLASKLSFGDCLYVFFRKK